MGVVGKWLVMAAVVSQWALLESAFAERRELQIKHQLLTEVPKDYRNDPHYIYKKHFQHLDPSIARDYRDRWSFHEGLTPYLSTDLAGEHFDIGASHFVGKAPAEHSVRGEFASRVFRSRVDGAIRNYLKGQGSPRILRQATESIEKVRNVEVTVAKAPTAPRFNFGYDVLTDESRIEMRSAFLNVGVYHPQLLATFTSETAPSFISEMTIQVGASVGPLPYTRIGIRPGSKVLEAVVSQNLSPQWISEFVSTQPLSAGASLDSYGVILRYLF